MVKTAVYIILPIVLILIAITKVLGIQDSTDVLRPATQPMTMHCQVNFTTASNTHGGVYNGAVRVYEPNYLATNTSDITCDNDAVLTGLHSWHHTGGISDLYGDCKRITVDCTWAPPPP